MANNPSDRQSVVVDAIYTRIKRDGFDDSLDLFASYRETKNLVLSLVPFLGPPSLVVPTQSLFPTKEEVGQLIDAIFDKLSLPVECAIVGLIYIDRVRMLTSLHKTSWRLVVTLCFLLAAKMWEDQPRRWVLEISGITNINATKLRAAEAKLCDLIKFHLHIDAEEYRQYTIGLRGKKDRPILSRRPSHLVLLY